MSSGSSAPVTPEAWEPASAAECAAFMEETRAAMNVAREGPWIADTEGVVRDAGERLRHRAVSPFPDGHCEMSTVTDPGNCATDGVYKGTAL